MTEINDDEVSKKLDVIGFVDRDRTIKTDVTDEKEVIFSENRLPIVVYHRHKLSPSGASCSRRESKRRDIKCQGREISSKI